MEDIKVVSNRISDTVGRLGVDKAQFSVAQSETREFNVEGGEFSLFRTLFDNELALTVYHQNKKGSAVTNKLDEASLEAAVEGALASAESAIADEAYDIAPGQGEMCFHDSGYEPDLDRFFERTRELLEDIGKRHPKIMVKQVTAAHEKSHSIYRNTNGTQCEVFRGSYTVSLMFAGHEGDKTTSFFGAGVRVDDLDTRFIELGMIEEQLKDAEAQLETIPFEGKFEGTIVLTPDSLGELLQSILENFAGDPVILEKTSLWLNKLNEKVADERLTISLRPSDERIVNKSHITGDGFQEEDYDIIRNGVLRSFMLSLYVANKTGLERAKNSSSAVVVEGGQTPYKEMIQGIKKGIIVGRFSGGQPGTNGEFSGVAKNSFLVEDGQITGAVSEVMISGNLADMLLNLRDISKETVADGASVLPYVAFDKIVISGK